MRNILEFKRWLLLVVIVSAAMAPLSGLAAAAAAPPAEPAWKVVEELWYTIELGGGKAGWSSTKTETDSTHFRTTSETNLKINRGSMPIEIKMASTFLETAEGKPVEVTLRQTMSLQAVESRWTFLDDHVKMTVIQGGNETVSDKPLPEGKWLTPHAADQYADAQRLAGAETITYRTIDPQSGLKPMTITSTRIGAEELDIDGKAIDVTVWTTTNDLVQIASTDKIDADGTLVYQEAAMAGLGTMATRLTTKARATGDADAPAPELMLQTFIKPDKPIENSMAVTRAKLQLTAKEGRLPELPSVGAQRVEMSPDGKSAVLTIDINDSVPASAADVENPEYRQPSAMVDSEDELIKKLAQRAVSGSEGGDESGGDAMKRAEALRRLAHRHISRKGMETAFASASETAKTRTGDCSEHGVLLAALMRADGIPARVAVGLIYAEAFAGEQGIFGWHMWTQALIDGKWVDFDATLPRRYTATHVTTGTSSLNDGVFTGDMAAVIQLIGNLDIQVLEVECQ